MPVRAAGRVLSLSAGLLASVGMTFQSIPAGAPVPFLRRQQADAELARAAVRAAPVAAWSTVASGVWRVALVVGVPGVMGREEFLASFPDNSALLALGYVLLLGAVAEAASYLTLGLVRPRGEVVPRWIPLLGGRPV
ncbi:hypothetical protein [Streptomyces sp. NPDC017520]|uniref:hypothetical protein n=1 Tax=Streptomyces sp. NPDC017520 TaxID=3364998 RepID=UPI003793A05B